MSLTTQQKAFLFVSLVHKGKAAQTLFSQVSEEQRPHLQNLFNQVSERREREIKAVCRVELQKMASAKTKTFLHEVHTDWLVRDLCKESPFIASIILRYLPSQKAAEVLEKLPEDFLNKMPKLSDTFSVSQQILLLLKNKFEEIYSYPAELNPKKEFQFEHFCFFNSQQIDKIFLELGYREIALALVSLPEEPRLSVMERFKDQNRLRVQSYLTKLSHISEKRIKKAQYHLVNLEVTPANPLEFVRELGYTIYAKSILPQDLLSLRIVMKKISFDQAQWLKKRVDEHLEKTQLDTFAVVFREDFMSMVTTLFKNKDLS